MDMGYLMPNRDDGNQQEELLGFFGIGLDNDDGHKRITNSEHFLLLGGSAETHEKMQATVLRFDEKLKNKGKSLRETEPEEALDMLFEALED